MDAESFTDLALRVVAGDASAEERIALERELAASPGRREEFDALKITHDLLRVTAPMAEAVGATGPELPAYRVNELRTAARRHFGPEAQREKVPVGGIALGAALRWLMAGSGFAVVGVAVMLFCCANRTVDIGLYGSGTERGGDEALTAADVPGANLVTFEQDAPFDEWQDKPLAWYEHGKIWVDNEHDVLYIVRRVRIGQVVKETEPLAPTNEGQKEQIKRAVEGMEK